MCTVTLYLLVLLCFNFHANCEILSDGELKILLGNGVTSKEAISEFEKKREIAKNYLSGFTKENWIDPFDMITSPVHESQSTSPIKSEHVEPSTNGANVDVVDDDYRPLFSDIKEEVIGSNSLSKDDTEYYNSKNDGNLLSKGRHQICILDSIYISRWLKKLISKIESDSEEPTALNILLDSESLIELKAISVAKSLEIADLDETMCNLIAKATILRREAYDWTFITDLLIKACIFICSCMACYFLYICMTTSPVYTLVCCVLSISVFWHWMQLYQKQIAFKHYQLSSLQIPTGCQKVELGIIEHVQAYIKSFFAKEDCVKYYEALMVNPIWEVSLTVAVSETLASALFQPLYSASKAINASVKILFADLSLLNMLILVIFLFLFFLMLSGYKLKFPFFLGALEPSNVVHNYVEEVKSVKKPRIKKLRNKSLEVSQNLVESTSEEMSLPSGSTNLYKTDNILKFSSTTSNDLPSKFCCNSLINRYSAEENKKSSVLMVSNSKNSLKNTEDSLAPKSTNKSDNCYERCGSKGSLIVNKTKMEEHYECKCEIKGFDSVCDDQTFVSHIEVEGNSFDHECAKCESDSSKLPSPNRYECIECMKNDPE